MKSIKIKMILLMLGNGLGVMAILVAVTFFSINTYSNRLIQNITDTIFSDYDANVKSQVDNVISLLETIYSYQKQNSLSDEEGKRIAANYIRGLKYGESGYFFADDYEGINYVNPPDPSTEGKSRIALKDFNGKELIREIIENGRKEGGGFTEYWYPKPGQTKADRKRTYSRAFEPYRWVIGTGNYVDDLDKLVQQKRNENREYFRYLAITILVILFLLCVVTIAVSLYYGNSLSMPIILAAETADMLAHGDLTGRIDKIYEKRDDEIGLLVASINNANDSLQTMISSLATAIQNLYYAIEQISQGNQNLSQRTTEQASALEEIASTIEETAATISQNTDNARLASERSVGSSHFAEKGGELVGSAVASINEISDASRKIEEITGVINDIAFQTNLLALNAAVEAARAGEQGRGFAVVASEVRNLAQRSGAAAKEIGALIRDSVDKIAKGTDEANNSGQAINEIIASVKNVTEMISEITLASEEQKTGISQINEAISDLDSMTQQNAALVEEVASASEEMSAQAMDLLTIVKQFKTD